MAGREGWGERGWGRQGGELTGKTTMEEEAKEEEKEEMEEEKVASTTMKRGPITQVLVNTKVYRYIRSGDSGTSR